MDPDIRALVVDDDEDTIDMVSHIIEIHGKLKPSSTTSVDTALEMLHSHAVLVTDYSLGADLNGIELARIFKRGNPRGFAILLTGYDRIKDSSVDIVLMKPVRMEKIHAALLAAHDFVVSKR